MAGGDIKHAGVEIPKRDSILQAQRLYFTLIWGLTSLKNAVRTQAPAHYPFWLARKKRLRGLRLFDAVAFSKPSP